MLRCDAKMFAVGWMVGLVVVCVCCFVTFCAFFVARGWGEIDTVNFVCDVRVGRKLSVSVAGGDTLASNFQTRERANSSLDQVDTEMISEIAF